MFPTRTQQSEHRHSCRRRDGSQRRTSHACLMRVLTAVVLLVVALLSERVARSVMVMGVTPQNSSATTSSSLPPNQKYEWEDWDYYQILGLDSPIISLPDPKQIKAAYRKQAQRWHPDKLIHHHRDSGNSSSSIGNARGGVVTSVEEGNARFARIAEAYQVLSDDQKRREYDAYLTAYRRNEATKYQKERPRPKKGSLRQMDVGTYPSSSWDSIMDPLRFFEEFFASVDNWMDEEDGFNLLLFPDEDADPAYLGGGGGPSMFPGGYNIHKLRGGSWQTPLGNDGWWYQSGGHYGPPDRIYEEQHILVDPATGQDILRIVQTEEYFIAPDQSMGSRHHRRQVYYRIVAQDFVDQYDPDQRAWVYRSLQHHPFLVEEGYRPDQPGVGSGPAIEMIRGGSGHGANYDDDAEEEEAILWPGEFLPAGAALRNGPYQAFVTPECQLSLSDQEQQLELWSSQSQEADAPFLYGQHCRLELHGPLLVLSAISHYHPGGQQHVIWHSELSDDSEEESPWMNDPRTSNPGYFARMDMDGSLAVYRVDSTSSSSGRHQQKRRRQGQVCITAVGSPVGCSRLGRRLVQAYRDVRRLFRRVVLSLLSIGETP